MPGALLGPLTADTPNDMVFRGNRLYTTDPSDFIRVYDSLTGALLVSLAGPSLLMSPKKGATRKTSTEGLLIGYLWQGNTQGKAHAKFRFKPVE